MRRGRLAAGLLLIATSLFIGVVVTRFGAPGLDASLVASAERWRDGISGQIMRWASDVGYSRWLVPASLALALAIGWHARGWHDELLVASATALAALEAHWLKLVFERDRPSIDPQLLATGYAMPSGHAAASSAFAASLFLVADVLPRRARLPIRILLVLGAVTVCASRVVLGVHWPTDVLAGACLGVGTALVLDAMLPERQRRRV